MRSFIILLCLIPTLLFARQSQLKTLLEQAIKGKKAEIGIAGILAGKEDRSEERRVGKECRSRWSPYH